MIPDYILTSKYVTLNRYNIEIEYKEYSLKYIKINIDDIGKIIPSDKKISYGALSSISECDYVAIDIDKLPLKLYYIENNKFVFKHSKKLYESLLFILDKIFLEFKEANIIERIDVFQSSETYINRNTPFHIYIKLNRAVDVEPFYKNYLITQIICGGYLTFINYNSFTNIRIDKKQNDSNINTTITPMLSKTNKDTIIYPLFDKWKNIQ